MKFLSLLLVFLSFIPVMKSSALEKPAKPEPIRVKITIGRHVFRASLDNNEAAKAFRALLPLKVEMADLNNNEKYCRLGKKLPASASNPHKINKGDLMLFGSDTLVVFYESFPTSYSYTRLGSIDEPEKLKQAMGSGSITLTFEEK